MRLEDFVTLSEIDPDLLSDVGHPNDFISVCKRFNNNKRGFLFVNHKQGKHVPMNPNSIYSLFRVYADKAREGIFGKKARFMSSEEWKNSVGRNVVFVGFAETATAFGMSSAWLNRGIYMQTSRSYLTDGITSTQLEHINFSEEHSHAVGQYVYKTNTESDDVSLDYLKSAESIVFCEDEITTGKTILNLVSALRNKGWVSEDVKFYTMSVLNWQSEESLEKFKVANVTPLWLVKGLLKDSINDVEVSDVQDFDTSYYNPDDVPPELFNLYLHMPTQYGLLRHGYDFRVLYEKFYEMIRVEASKVKKLVDELGWHRICVLGTEEYMFIPMMIAMQLCHEGYEVKFHATTRSPITPSKDYIISSGRKFHSLENFEVVNYLYNYEPNNYDGTVVIASVDTDRDKMNTVDNLAPVGKCIFYKAEDYDE